MGPDGALTDPPRTWMGQFYQWLRHSWHEAGGQALLRGQRVASGSHAAEPLVESRHLHLRQIGEWTFRPRGAGPSLTPPVQGYSHTNTPISSLNRSTSAFSAVLWSLDS